MKNPKELQQLHRIAVREVLNDGECELRAQGRMTAPEYQVSFYWSALEDRTSRDQYERRLMLDDPRRAKMHLSTVNEAFAFIDQLPKDAVHDLSIALLVEGSVAMEFSLGDCA